MRNRIAIEDRVFPMEQSFLPFQQNANLEIEHSIDIGFTQDNRKIIVEILYFGIRSSKKVSYFYTVIQKTMLYCFQLFHHYSTSIIIIEFQYGASAI